MRMSLFAAGLVVGLAFAPAACKKNDKDGDKTAAEPAGDLPADPPTGDPAGGHGSGTGGGSGSDMVNKMMHCPSAVDGAETAVSQTAAAVIVTVTAADPAKATEIQKRAKHLAGLTLTTEPEVKHTGQGTGGGALGKCPVVMKDVTLSVDDQNDGARITLTPKNPAQLANLAKTAQDRAAALSSGAAVPPVDEDTDADAE
jgi:hypothetical protein